MNRFISNFLSIVFLTAALCSAVYAEHDNGQGKSQDGPLSSVSVAPEPSTFWLLLSGTLLIAAYVHYKKNSLPE